MSTDLLFEQFATLATAPEGIARLRELILQLAMQGKLGTEDAGDEPASVAVDAFFRKNKHIKKKHFVNIEEKSRLPNGWISITLGNIGQWALGTGFPISIQGHTDMPILFCKVSDMNLPGNEKWIKTTNHTIDEGIKNQYNIKIHSKGTVIFPKIGGAIATNKRRIISRLTAIDNNCLGITPNDFCSTDWLFLILTSIDFTQYQSGTSMPALNQGTLAEIVTSLPPLAEQQRIIVKIDRLMAICDELEARQQQERAGCLKLGTASLAGLQNAESSEEFGRRWAQVCDAFDLILDCPKNVAVLRQTILQLAVQGRLVRQEPGDEPAEKLVERIRKEKERLVKEGIIPKERDLDPVSKAEMPFTLPNNWIWVKWNDISLQIQDVDHRMPTACSEGIPYISPRDFGPNNKIHFNTAKKISKADFDSLKTKIQPEKNDIIFPRYGTIGENRFIETDIEFLASYSCTTIKTLTGFVNPKYTFYFSISPLVQSQIEKSINKTTQANVGLKSIQNYLFPLPPLAEQHRIVAKVDTLMALCDALESRLKERAGVQEKFANAVVGESS
jgi:type I restriction enzyme S subunit